VGAWEEEDLAIVDRLTKLVYLNAPRAIIFVLLRVDVWFIRPVLQLCNESLCGRYNIRL
jgi:hypothetical protein